MFPALATTDSYGKLVPFFRPLVLRDVLDDYARRRRDVHTGTHVLVDDHDDILHITEPDTPTYTAPISGTGHVALADSAHRWSLATDQPYWAAARTGSLAIVATPDGEVAASFVTAATDIEQLDPTQWVTVAEHLIVPARRQLIIVTAGNVALFEPQHHRDDQPEDCAEDEEWLPFCYHCGQPLLDPGSIPGMPYPMADGPANPWCPQHPDPSPRARPCAATWALRNYTTGAVIRPGDEGFARHHAEQAMLAQQMRASNGF